MEEQENNQSQNNQAVDLDTLLDARVEIIHVGDGPTDGKIYEVVKKYGCFKEREARDLQKYLTRE